MFSVGNILVVSMAGVLLMMASHRESRVDGILDLHRFELDHSTKDVIPAHIEEKYAQSVSHCGTFCRKVACFGFFYNDVSKLCVPIRNYFVAELKTMPNVSYYKRQVHDGAHYVSLEYNICPRLEAGNLVINITSSRQYKIFVDPQQSTHGEAFKACQRIGKKLLRMKDNWHYIYIQALLRTCREFQGSEFWIGAKLTGSTYKYPDGATLDMSYFCPGFPDAPSTEHCVRFQSGCLNDFNCQSHVGFMCE